jgi:leucyl aminopeptidase
MPGGNATKPGDVVYAMDGQSIEVLNTDAEGRLILADGVAYAKSQDCNPLIDVATLTGAISTALGKVRYGVHTNNDRLMADLERAAEQAGERLWRMPMDKDYEELIKSDVADVKNTGGPQAGSITGAKLIEKFAGDTPWAHLDIAGVMDSERERGEWVKGASGQPVRTLVHFVLNAARAPRSTRTQAARPQNGRRAQNGRSAPAGRGQNGRARPARGTREVAATVEP